MSVGAELERCIAGGGVAIFPADTVYGLCCDAANPQAVARLYQLKGRPSAKPAAVLFADVEGLLSALPQLGPRTAAAVRRLLPGSLTLLVPNPTGRFPLAGPGQLLGVRVAELAFSLGRPVLQSSANLAGGPEARRLTDVDERLRAAVDLAVDGGELPGRSSTVIDLGDYEDGRRWRIVRSGAVGTVAVERALGLPN